MLSLTTPWAVRALAGSSPAAVGVRNLSTRTMAARDAWGRPGKEQPLLLSVSVEFASGFERAGKTDSLGTDTVHYGTLSKAILASTSNNKDQSGGGLAMVVGDAWTALTGRNIGSDGKEGAGMIGNEVRFLSITAMLPKASLLGSGVSWTVSECFGTGVYATILTVHDLRVPTLIGINVNERLAKQFVIATVMVEGVEPLALQDKYTELERMVVKTMENSSFGTIEALAKNIGDQVLSLWRGRCKEIRIHLEKPTAVPLADTPVVEIRLSGNLPSTRT